MFGHKRRIPHALRLSHIVTVGFVVLSALVLLSLLQPSSAHLVKAQTSDAQIDFETIPGGTPQEGLIISDQFVATAGVSFALEGGGYPVLADVGGEATAFLGHPNNSAPDTPAPDQPIGQYFLTDDGEIGGESPNLIVNYDPPTAAASGVVLDVDNRESYTIEARDASDTVLQTVSVSAGDPGTGDGLATRWSLERENADIVSLRFRSGTPSTLIGLGFDNFNARSAINEVYLPLIRR
jgi:hypothetical protein